MAEEEEVQEIEETEPVINEPEFTIRSVKFEITGRVQGVWFRTHAVEKGNELGVRGYVRNTPKGTVEGIVQGEEENYNKMKDWLSNEGSPESRIYFVEWGEEEFIPEYTFPDFCMKA